MLPAQAHLARLAVFASGNGVKDVVRTMALPVKQLLCGKAKGSSGERKGGGGGEREVLGIRCRFHDRTTPLHVPLPPLSIPFPIPIPIPIHVHNPHQPACSNRFWVLAAHLRSS